MNRIALFLLVFLAGCTTAPETLWPDAEPYELVGWDWCDREVNLRQCRLVHQGAHIYVMDTGDRFGDGSDVWDTKSEIVQTLGLSKP